MSAHYWRNGAPTEAAITAFTEGDCWILALCLYDLTGWPVYVIDAGEREGIHWVVRVPDKDCYLDITGVYTRHRLLQKWEATGLRKADDNIVTYALRDYKIPDVEVFRDSYRRAPVIAQKLVDKYTTIES